MPDRRFLRVDESKVSATRKRGRSAEAGLDMPMQEEEHSSITDHLDSAAAQTVAILEDRIKNCRLIEKQNIDLEKKKLESNIALAQQNELQMAEVAVLNVGGKVFSIPRKTLLSADENSYFHSLFILEKGSSLAVQRDEAGIIFIDRDPEVFRYILNYLRGYTKFDKMEGTLAKKLRIDAQFFRLPKLLRLLEEEKRDRLQFRPGPGVNADGDRLRVAFGVAIVGEHDLVTGKHKISFEVISDEYVGIGIVSDLCTVTDHEFHKTPLCCVYYMSGVFYSNYPHHKKEESSDTIVRFTSGDRIDVEMDMEKGIAEFVVHSAATKKAVSKFISLGKTKRLRFAVTAKSNSIVRIVHDSKESVINVIE